jgi:hypothetical protein
VWTRSKDGFGKKTKNLHWRQDQKEEEEEVDVDYNGRNMWKEWHVKEKESYQR